MDFSCRVTTADSFFFPQPDSGFFLDHHNDLFGSKGNNDRISKCSRAGSALDICSWAITESRLLGKICFPEWRGKRCVMSLVVFTLRDTAVGLKDILVGMHKANTYKT